MPEAAEEKWWLAFPLPETERREMTEMQRQERRLHMVNRRLDRATATMRDKRGRWMRRMFHTYFRGEILSTVGYHDSPFDSLQRWLREEFLSAIKDAFAGRDQQALLEQTIRGEVGREITRIMGGFPGTSREGRDALQRYVSKIVQDEVRKQLLDSLSFEATIKGHVHQPAKGVRGLRLEGEE